MAEESEPKVQETAQPEFSVRSETFLAEYGKLVESLKVDFATYPVFIPDGQGGFKVIVQNTPVDMNKQPVRSEFMSKE